jgi:hypothetical protein
VHWIQEAYSIECVLMHCIARLVCVDVVDFVIDLQEDEACIGGVYSLECVDALHGSFRMCGCVWWVFILLQGLGGLALDCGWPWAYDALGYMHAHAVCYASGRVAL